MRQNNKSILIISQSGRALAASAARAGLPVTVIDRFADTDSQSLASKCFAVEADGMGLDNNHLRAILQSIPEETVAGVITGSGLERSTDLIADLPESWRYYGNPPAVWRSCNDPMSFTAMLDSLDIRYPETQLDRPAESAGWLVKQKNAAGGSHVTYLLEEPAYTENVYFQKYLEGRNISVVFLANADNGVMIGVSDTEVANRKQGDFRYCGAVSSVTIAAAVEQQLRDIVTRLVRRLALRGLCGIDVIIDNREQCWLLELNPRPTATFELYEREKSLLDAHISACQGQLPRLPTVTGCSGQHVFYTDVDVQIPSLEWPAWVTDRPVAGRVINTGEPVCTVHAHGNAPEKVRHDLHLRTGWLQEQFGKHCHAA